MAPSAGRRASRPASVVNSSSVNRLSKRPRIPATCVSPATRSLSRPSSVSTAYVTRASLAHCAFVLETPGEEMLEGRENLDALRSLL